MKLKTDQLTFSYDQQKAVDKVCIEIKKGEFVGIIGPNGSGKSTLLKNIYRALNPDSGEITLDGENLLNMKHKKSAQKMAVVGQENEMPFDFTVEEIVAMGRSPHKKIFDSDTDHDKYIVHHALEHLGMENMAKRSFQKLSGGEKQRVLLARTVAQESDFLILDEPTSQLDPIAASDFIATLQKINRELGLTIILVEHRLEEVFPIADKVLILDGGRSMYFASPREVGQLLCEENNQHNMILGLPTAVRIYKALDIKDECPLTVKEGRAFLERHFGGVSDNYIPQRPEERTDIAIKLENVWFRYEKALRCWRCCRHPW